MNRALHHRIRWRNVARAVLLLLAVALIVAWPRLRAAAPTVPEAPPAVTEPVPRAVTQELPQAAPPPRSRRPHRRPRTARLGGASRTARRGSASRTARPARPPRRTPQRRAPVVEAVPAPASAEFVPSG